MPEEKVTGKVGFEGTKPTEDIITKEETMFKIDKDGKAIPEKYSVYIYDRNLDRELIEETLLLMQTIKKEKAIEKVIADTITKQNQEAIGLQSKIEKETDEKKKKLLQNELAMKKNTEDIEDIKTRINTEVIQDGIRESRDIIKQLKAEIEKQKQRKFIEMSPCTTSEAYFAFDKGQTIEGKSTTDWVADLIAKKVATPQYTIEEAKRLKPDYKMAIKEAIMEVSNYKLKSYRDIMMEIKLQEEKPKTVKKE